MSNYKKGRRFEKRLTRNKKKKVSPLEINLLKRYYDKSKIGEFFLLKTGIPINGVNYEAHNMITDPAFLFPFNVVVEAWAWSPMTVEDLTKYLKPKASEKELNLFYGSFCGAYIMRGIEYLENGTVLGPITEDDIKAAEKNYQNLKNGIIKWQIYEDIEDLIAKAESGIKCFQSDYDKLRKMYRKDV